MAISHSIVRYFKKLTSPLERNRSISSMLNVSWRALPSFDTSFFFVGTNLLSDIEHVIANHFLLFSRRQRQ